MNLFFQGKRYALNMAICLLCTGNFVHGQAVVDTSAEAAIGNRPALAYTTQRDVLYRTGDDLTDYQHQRCRLDVYHPQRGVSEPQTKFPTVVWFHGGGLKSGNKEIPNAIMNQGIAVVAANYRLHPKVKSPDYVDDAAAAVAWVFENIEKMGGDSDSVFISGHSAGGYLALMVGMDKQYLSAYDIDSDRIAGLIPYSGHTITHFTVRAELGIDAEQPIIDCMAPLFHVRKDAPPMLLITGDRDLELLGRYEENSYFWRMMQVKQHPACNLIEIKGCNHREMVEPAHENLLKFIRENTS